MGMSKTLGSPAEELSSGVPSGPSSWKGACAFKSPHTIRIWLTASQVVTVATSASLQLGSRTLATQLCRANTAMLLVTVGQEESEPTSSSER